MSLVRPKFIILDSSTLGKVSKDYWNSDVSLRIKAQTFISDLKDCNVFITLTMTHVIELLGVRNKSIINERLSFLRNLPLIAWLKPYDGRFFPGTIIDLHIRELHAVVHNQMLDWKSIIEHVRLSLWEVGVGSKLFVKDSFGWDVLQLLSEMQQKRNQYIASILRTDPEKIKELTMGELKSMAKRPKSEWPVFLNQFASKMKMQLEKHGDKRLETPEEAAKSFAIGIHKDLYMIDSRGGDLVGQILKLNGVPKELVSDETTVDEVGQLAVYIKNLNFFTENLHPKAKVTVQAVPPDMLPSYLLEHKLAQIQRKAPRASGSDIGDGHIAPLVFYVDGIEVDKRTHEYLKQIQRAFPSLGNLMGRYFRSSDYLDILDVCNSEI